ncbi:ATPase synthesis protein 25 mitochondrial [Arachnomyces sp. PD_36]|nr:ATPase synthesis protein 25 mitochondrial [Arachnomyces sp. PD_36]
MSGALLRSPWCRACRNNLFQSLAVFSGVPVQTVALPSRTTFAQHPRKSFSVLLPRLSDQIPSGSQPNSEAAAPENESKNEDSSAVAPEEHVPWYLQVETPDLPQTPQAARQDLPPLPDNPPPILEDVLQHISVDIGLDDLVLYDLRKLDPPPALGANLIMIIGTARSVKHLNVSADRLCRWLRSKYKLQPDADGLLGRNELKIKLRRKARRAKLASAAGNSLDNHDDGITTGWICVNAGVVEDTHSEAPKKQQDKNFVGFGEAVQGTRIVVQMLTEEKRADIDLEGLWSTAIDRKSRRDAKLSGTQSDAPLDEVGAAHDNKAVSSSDRDLRGTHRLRNSIDQGQRRSMHTCGRLQGPDSTLRSDISIPNIKPSQPNSRIAGKSESSTTSVPQASTIAPLFQYLSDLPEDEAIQQLGRGPNDHNSTQFLDIFYKTLTQTDESGFALNELELIRRAVALHHPAYTKHHLFEHFNECLISGYDLSEHQMWQIMDTLLLPQPQNADRNSPILRIPESDVNLALKVLDHMSLRGMNILTGRIISSLYRASSFQVPVHSQNRVSGKKSPQIDPREAQLVRNRQQKLERTLEGPNTRWEADDFINLLRGRSNQGDYQSYMDIWGKIALLGIPRTEKLYTFFFKAHAEQGNQRICLDILSLWPAMMERESPRVPLRGELAKTVMACILVADPDITQNAEENPGAELPSLWKRCLESLKPEKQTPV